MKTLQHTRQHLRPNLPLTRDFELFLGRRLTPREHAVIWPIERARRRHKPQPLVNPGLRRGSEPRILVFDRPGEDSAPLLLDYLRFLQQHVAPAHIPDGGDRPLPVLLVTRRRSDALDIQHDFGLYGPTAAASAVEHVRGQDFSVALVLDAHTFGKLSPYRRNSQFHRVIRTVTPTVSDSPLPIVIIHLRCRMSRHRRNPLPVLPELPDAYLPLSRADTAYRDFLRTLSEQNALSDTPILILIDDPPPDPGPPLSQAQSQASLSRPLTSQQDFLN